MFDLADTNDSHDTQREIGAVHSRISIQLIRINDGNGLWIGFALQIFNHAHLDIGRVALWKTENRER